MGFADEREIRVRPWDSRDTRGIRGIPVGFAEYPWGSRNTRGVRGIPVGFADVRGVRANPWGSRKSVGFADNEKKKKKKKKVLLWGKC